RATASTQTSTIVAASSESGVSDAVQKDTAASTSATIANATSGVRPMCLAASARTAAASTVSNPAVQRRLSPISQTSQRSCVAANPSTVAATSSAAATSSKASLCLIVISVTS